MTKALIPSIRRLLSMVVGMLGFTCCQAQSDSIITVNANEFEKYVGSDSAIVVDVRTADEFNAGHISGAKNIDVLQSDFKVKVATLPTDKTIAVYCRSGKRSLKAAKVLAQHGYKVVNLRGGWIEWTEKQNDNNLDNGY